MNNKIYEVCDADKCTGCCACADACTQNCITIKQDEDGFYQSCIDLTRCVSCLKCVSVCSANNPNKRNRIADAYKARIKDEEELLRSTSGGIASELGRYVINNGGVVFGCGFNEDLFLCHSMATTLHELEKFKGSKYLQSYTAGIYSAAKCELDKGTLTLFIGTPCQVSGLLNYLQKDYSNLYTVDLLCHGVMSHKVFDKFLSGIKNNEKPLSASFRNKDNGYADSKARNAWKITYSDETVKNTTDDGAFLWFGSSLSIRKSCYKCDFVSEVRPGDLTLADNFSGDKMSDCERQSGAGTVFVNSQKGEYIFGEISDYIEFERRNTDETISKYKRLTEKCSPPKARERFFEDLNEKTYEEMVKEYTLDSILPSIFLRRINGIRSRIKKIAKLK